MAKPRGDNEAVSRNAPGFIGVFWPLQVNGTPRYRTQHRPRWREAGVPVGGVVSSVSLVRALVLTLIIAVTVAAPATSAQCAAPHSLTR